MCASTPAGHLLLAPDAAAAGTARRFLRRTACRAHAEDALDSAELLLTELVTNAVRHGAPPVVVSIGCHEVRGLRIHVEDAGRGRPVVRDPDPDELGGRGLLLVEGLSTAWGVHPARPGRAGKRIWFTLGGPAAGGAPGAGRTSA